MLRTATTKLQTKKEHPRTTYRGHTYTVLNYIPGKYMVSKIAKRGKQMAHVKRKNVRYLRDLKRRPGMHREIELPAEPTVFLCTCRSPRWSSGHPRMLLVLLIVLVLDFESRRGVFNLFAQNPPPPSTGTESA